MKGELTQAFKIIKGIDNIAISSFPSIGSGANMEMGSRSSVNLSTLMNPRISFFFFSRIVYLWNGLPSDVVECNTVDTFKHHLDK